MPVKQRNKRLKWIVGAVLAAVAVVGATLMAAAPKTEFDGNRAFDILKRQCDYGPRPVGTLAHEKLRAYLTDAMKQVADKVTVQDFNWTRSGKTYRLSNIIGVLNPDARTKVMIAGHWDTRPTADQETDPEKRKQPIMGANDGASEVGVVLELARALKAKRPQVGVIYMLFDGEDFGPDVGNMFLGASYFAHHPGAYRPDQMILVDMVGDANVAIYKELHSLDSDRSLIDKVWTAAAKLGYSKQFPNESGLDIEDDHIPMEEAGIPSIDLIGLNYNPGSRYPLNFPPSWHTLGDTVDKCSPASLEAVGRTLQDVVMNW